jgi:hypothetical protein
MAPLVAVWGWGEHATAYATVNSWIPPAPWDESQVSQHTASFALTGPTDPGEYFISIAFALETNGACVASLTNWQVDNRLPHWNDDRDIADWGAAEYAQSTAEHRVTTEYEFTSGWGEATLPAAMIKVVVLPPKVAQAMLIPDTWYSYWTEDPRGAIRAYLGDLPDGYVASDIDPATIRLNGEVPIYGGRYRMRPAMPGFTGEVMEIAFSRPAAVESLGDMPAPGVHTVEISGELTDGTDFVAHVDITLADGAAKQTEIVPDNYTLGNAYPNPFNAQSRIEFGLPTDGLVRLDVYNVLGHRVKRLVDRRMSAGMHEVTWDGTNAHGQVVSSGAYYYRIQVGEFVETRSMMLLK